MEAGYFILYLKELHGFRHDSMLDVRKAVKKFKDAGELEEIVRIDRVEDVTDFFLKEE